MGICFSMNTIRFITCDAASISCVNVQQITEMLNPAQISRNSYDVPVVTARSNQVAYEFIAWSVTRQETLTSQNLQFTLLPSKLKTINNVYEEI